MATVATVQMVVDYLKSHPAVAQEVKARLAAHPDEVKAALKQVADEQGWDLSKVDPAALKAEIAQLK